MWNPSQGFQKFIYIEQYKMQYMFSQIYLYYKKNEKEPVDQISHQCKFTYKLQLDIHYIEGLTP
jgi:hypothetical protein